MSFYIYKNNEQSGLFDESFIESGLRSRSFLPNNLARREDMGEWSPLGTFFPLTMPLASSQPIKQAVPKCLSSGAITEWTVEPIFLPRHWVVF